MSTKPGDLPQVDPAQPAVGGADSASRRRVSGVGGSWLLSAAILVTTVIVWQLAYSQEWVSTLILPSPWSVAYRLYSELVVDLTIWPHIFDTAKATVLAFLVGSTVGVALGMTSAFFPIIRQGLYPFILAGQSMPKIAIAPMLVAYLGYGAAPKVAIGAAICFFPVFVNTVAGLTDLDADELEFFASLRATRMEELRMLRIPRAFSYILPSLDIAVVGALLGVIAGELVGSRSGLGYLVQTQAFYGDSTGVFAVLIIMAAMGLLLRSGVVGASRLTRYGRAQFGESPN